MVSAPAHLQYLSLFSQWGPLLACLVTNECVTKDHAVVSTHMYVSEREPITQEMSPHNGNFLSFI